MKCISCETEINPKWKAAIDKNECPFCGNVILNVQLKEALGALYELMLSVQTDFSLELEDWMLSNFGFIKTTSDKLVEFVPPEMLSHANRTRSMLGPHTRIEKVIDQNGEHEVIVQKHQSEDVTNGFFSRAEAVKPKLDGFSSVEDKTHHLKNVVNQIKGRSLMTEEDVAAEAKMQAELEGLDDHIRQSGSLSSDDTGGEEIPDFVAQMANQASGGGQYKSKADMAILRNLMAKKANSQNAFENGERPTDASGRPAGFSRLE